jgi:uncharacterized protein (DUF1800 family)
LRVGIRFTSHIGRDVMLQEEITTENVSIVAQAAADAPREQEGLQAAPPRLGAIAAAFAGAALAGCGASSGNGAGAPGASGTGSDPGTGGGAGSGAGGGAGADPGTGNGGGGGGSGGAGNGGDPGGSDPKPAVIVPPTAKEAARFLAQASLGATHAHIARVQSIGYAAWIDEQMAVPISSTRFDDLLADGYGSVNSADRTGFDHVAWRKLITAPDTFRQRITLALSEIVVVTVAGVGGGWPGFSASTFLDLLDANAFGNYRTLLQAISTSAPMSEFLTYRGNVKYNPATGAQPDENYARELMQLFTIGLQQLELDGSVKSVGGVPLETYTLDDITGLARVFTGWNYDFAGGNNSKPDSHRRPLIQNPAQHELGSKTFLGSTIPAGTDGVASLTMALDILFAHPNVAPFISRQLIQRLVSSNPTPGYIARVATVFNNDGTGVKGNLKAVIKAILLDDEARKIDAQPADRSGKQREPILRFTAWARAYGAASTSDKWHIDNTSSGAYALGQSPLRAPSVFNFFRPGYVPPNSAIAISGLVAPEFQITNESSVAGYVNFMQKAVSTGVGGFKADYSSLMPLADDAAALVSDIALVLAADQLTASTKSTIIAAVDSVPPGTDPNRLKRIYTAMLLVLASPEFIVLK